MEKKLFSLEKALGQFCWKNVLGKWNYEVSWKQMEENREVGDNEKVVFNKFNVKKIICLLKSNFLDLY